MQQQNASKRGSGAAAASIAVLNAIKDNYVPSCLVEVLQLLTCIASFHALFPDARYCSLVLPAADRRGALIAAANLMCPGPMWRVQYNPYASLAGAAMRAVGCEEHCAAMDYLAQPSHVLAIPPGHASTACLHATPDDVIATTDSMCQAQAVSVDPTFVGHSAASNSSRVSSSRGATATYSSSAVDMLSYIASSDADSSYGATASHSSSKTSILTDNAELTADELQMTASSSDTELQSSSLAVTVAGSDSDDEANANDTDVKSILSLSSTILASKGSEADMSCEGPVGGLLEDGPCKGPANPWKVPPVLADVDFSAGRFGCGALMSIPVPRLDLRSCAEDRNAVNLPCVAQRQRQRASLDSLASCSTAAGEVEPVIGVLQIGFNPGVTPRTSWYAAAGTALASALADTLADWCRPGQGGTLPAADWQCDSSNTASLLLRPLHLCDTASADGQTVVCISCRAGNMTCQGEGVGAAARWVDNLDLDCKMGDKPDCSQWASGDVCTTTHCRQHGTMNIDDCWGSWFEDAWLCAYPTENAGSQAAVCNVAVLRQVSNSLAAAEGMTQMAPGCTPQTIRPVAVTAAGNMARPAWLGHVASVLVAQGSVSWAEGDCAGSNRGQDVSEDGDNAEVISDQESSEAGFTAGVVRDKGVTEGGVSTANVREEAASTGITKCEAVHTAGSSIFANGTRPPPSYSMPTVVRTEDVTDGHAGQAVARESIQYGGSYLLHTSERDMSGPRLLQAGRGFRLRAAVQSPGRWSRTNVGTMAEIITGAGATAGPTEGTMSAGPVEGSPEHIAAGTSAPSQCNGLQVGAVPLQSMVSQCTDVCQDAPKGTCDPGDKRRRIVPHTHAAPAVRDLAAISEAQALLGGNNADEDMEAAYAFWRWQKLLQWGHMDIIAWALQLHMLLLLHYVPDALRQMPLGTFWARRLPQSTSLEMLLALVLMVVLLMLATAAAVTASCTHRRLPHSPRTARVFTDVSSTLAATASSVYILYLLSQQLHLGDTQSVNGRLVIGAVGLLVLATVRLVQAMSVVYAVPLYCMRAVLLTAVLLQQNMRHCPHGNTPPVTMWTILDVAIQGVFTALHSTVHWIVEGEQRRQFVTMTVGTPSPAHGPAQPAAATAAPWTASETAVSRKQHPGPARRSGNRVL